MIKSIKKLIARRAAERQERAYADGYDWAAGSLLRGDHTVEEIEAQVSPAYFCAPVGMFDQGAADAARKLNRIADAVRELNRIADAVRELDRIVDAVAELDAAVKQPPILQFKEGYA